MATLLDLSILTYLTPLFTFLFILVLSYAVLDKFKLMGESPVLKGIASLSIAMIFILSGRMIKVVNLATPWFMLMIIFGFFLLAMLMFMGVKEDAIAKTAAGGAVVWAVFIVSIVLFVIVIVNAFQDVQSPYEKESEKTRTTEGMNALLNPR